jgi:hypothetical protein
LPDLLYPSASNINDIVHNVFDTYGLALFPIDSTNPGSIFAFAQGRVHEPFLELQRLSKQFQSWSNDARKFSSAIKIILLHHHVVPLPADKLDERLEPFNLIQNPFQFLPAPQHKIDIILHGHRHVSGLSQLEMVSSYPGQPITISACGSSAKVGLSQPTEIKILDLTKSGAGVITTFENKVGVPNFTRRQEYPVLTYVERRQKRNYELTLYEPKYVSNVQRINRRTKTVKMEDNNMSEIHNVLDGIHWQAGATDYTIRQTISSEAGRLIRAGMILSASPQQRPRRLQTRQEIVKGPPSPHTEERVELEISPEHPLIWGIGVKRKFSASRTAFLRKL